MDSVDSGLINAISDLTSSEAACVDRVVEDFLGPDRKIIGVDKKVTVRETEVIMVNGTPIALEGEEGEAIKECLLRGSMPAQDLLNHLLLKAGLLVAPKRQIIQSDVKVNTAVTTTENAILHRNGEVVDRRTRQTKSANNIEGHSEELWEPDPNKLTNESDFCVRSSAPAPRRPTPNTKQISPKQGVTNHDYYVTNGHKIRSTDEPDCSTPRNLSSTSKSGGKLVSPAYSCRNGEVSDARVRHIKSSQRQLPPDPQPAGLGQLKSTDEPDFSRVRQQIGTNQLKPDDEADFSRLLHFSSSKRVTPSPLKRLSGLIYDEEGTVASGTLEELIHELVPRAHSSPSETFQFAFLLSSRLFLTPTRLMAEVYRRADQLAYMLSSESHPTFVQNLVTMLSRWMVWFPMDFREESMQQKTRQLVQLAVERHPAVEVRLGQLLHTLNTHLSAIEKHERQVDRLSQFSPSSSAPSAASYTNADLLQLEINASIFAQELTRIELEYLCFLGPEELVNAFARDSSSHHETSSGSPESEGEICEARQRAAKKTKNLEAYVTWFNRLSFLVATTVCQKKKKKMRVKVIEYWIEVARECINLGNFNSLMGIITGLNMTPVSRLRRTWSKIQSAGKFAVLEHQMDPTSNFLSYRSTLRAAVSRSEGATDQRQRVVVPFFSLLIKDLYFVNEGCASRLANGHINFAKALQLAEKLREFARWKDVECPYEKVHSVAELLQTYPVMGEEALDLESYECEQPELTEEKDRHKQLKQQFKTESH